jgi:hypothetical protein
MVAEPPRADPFVQAEKDNQNLPPHRRVPRIEFRGLKTMNGYPLAYFVMTNDTPHSFVYDAYDANSPSTNCSDGMGIGRRRLAVVRSRAGPVVAGAIEVDRILRGRC